LWIENFLEKMGLGQTDLTKVDIKVHDYFSLLGCFEYLSEFRNIQFEIGITASPSDATVSSELYPDLINNWFN
jgi:hypothetical protein